MLTRNIKNQFANLSYNDLKTQLKDFSHMDRFGCGSLNLEQFRSALNLPDSKYVTELFHLLDVNESGDIDFREYIAGRAIISQQLTTEESIAMAFNSFDCNHVRSIVYFLQEIILLIHLFARKGWRYCFG